MNRLSHFTHIIAWLADASNGIGNLYASIVHAHRVTADELCAGDVCVNQQQLAALLSQAASAATPKSVPSSPSNIREPEPPFSVSSTPH